MIKPETSGPIGGHRVLPKKAGFESIISYLREKEIRYSEIARLLNRDQRNIRTIYIRTLNK